MLNEWMTEKIGEDFYDVASQPAPPRLVAEPANYSACLTALKALTPIPGQGKPQRQPTTAQLRSKCEQLYQAIKTQALSYLVSSYWTIDFLKEHAITTTPNQVQKALGRLETSATPAGLQRLLANKRRSLHQEAFILRMDLLQQKLFERIRRGGQTAAALTSQAKAVENSAQCAAGYTVEHCTGYIPPHTSEQTAEARSPAVLLQEIARWRPRSSHGFASIP
jgi:hypothetical protein